jgi:hypothetical protein
VHLLTQLLLLARARAHAHERAGEDDDQRGQATAEYALVLLGAAAVALLVVSWATKTNVVAKLLDAVFGELLHRTTVTR